MSLINEALKRTEARKCSDGACDFGEPPMRPVVVRPRAERFSPVLVVIIAVAIAVTGSGVWIYFELSGLPSMAQTAVAAGHEARRQGIGGPAEPPVVPQLAAAEPAAPAVVPQLATAGRAEPAERLAEEEIIVAKSLATPVYRPAAPEARPAEARPVPPAQLDELAASFRLSAIMRGPQGATAIINGRFVEIGGMVNGAKLINVGRHTAELEYNHQRFTIQM